MGGGVVESERRCTDGAGSMDAGWGNVYGRARCMSFHADGEWLSMVALEKHGAVQVATRECCGLIACLSTRL